MFLLDIEVKCVNGLTRGDGEVEDGGHSRRIWAVKVLILTGSHNSLVVTYVSIC